MPSLSRCQCFRVIPRRVYLQQRYLASDATASSETVQPVSLDYEQSYEEGTWSEWSREIAQRRSRLAKRNKPLSSFVDHLTVEVEGGKGGDGCVAFHREKFKAKGPPAGGNGAPGGCIYIKPSASLTDLGTLKRRSKAANGENGKGSWLHGKRGEDLILEVPLGTVVKALPPRESYEDYKPHRYVYRSPEQREQEIQARRDAMFIHYPSDGGEHYAESQHFAKVEAALLESEKRAKKRQRKSPDFTCDLSVLEMDPVLVARGGLGGTGNPAFTSGEVRSPKFATRGKAGESLRLFLELKTIADVGLVGFPNRGKSTLLRSLSNAQATVAPYAFTTLSPQVGTIILYTDGSTNTEHDQSTVQDTKAIPQTFDSSTELIYKARRDKSEAKEEAFRFTMADCPGLLPDASQNVGLGHSFLRHIERARLLLYVVDLSLPNPELELNVLKTELENYEEGLSRRAKLVVANKADLCVGGQEEAAEKLERLHNWMRENSDAEADSVVMCSAKHRANSGKVLGAIRNLLVKDAEELNSD